MVEPTGLAVSGGRLLFADRNADVVRSLRLTG
jgi:hypothetical protein